MSFMDIIDELVPDKVPMNNYYITDLYLKALKLLNKIKLSRNSAMYFGTMQIGPEMCSWKDDKNNKDFTLKYSSCCILIMSDLYNKIKDRKRLTELSISILYSMLALFVEEKGLTLPEEVFKELEKNDKYFNNDLSKEFEE